MGSRTEDTAAEYRSSAALRQPEKMGDLRSSMIIAAALVEGVAFFAVIIAILAIVM